MEIISPSIENYLAGLIPPRNVVLLDMENRAKREDFPAVGPQVGMLLELLARAIKAERIIELGSGFGYSGLWLAKALPPQGKIILTDENQDNLKSAVKNFERMGLLEKMEYRLGNALEIFAQETGPFDLVFNDVDKEDYPQVIKLAHPRLRKGGLLVTDNTLWSGMVAENEPDETTRFILEHNRILAEHQGFLTVQLPLRDGISVSLKL